MMNMYTGKINSPETKLTEMIDAVKTNIAIEDGSVLPPGPNLATIGLDTTAETIKYESINNNILVGCVRGFQGIAKSWDVNTPIARNITEYDLSSLQENVTELDNVKLDADSKLDTNKVDFVEATTRINILATDSLKIIFGKIKKYFADLKTVAFTGKSSDLITDDSNLLVTKTEKTTWNNKYDAETKLTVTELNFTGTILALFKAIGTKLTEMTLRLIPTGGATGQVLKKTSDGFGWGTDENTKYTAGANVSISDGSISATDTKYTAGTNVTISENKISAIDTKYTAGENITIENNVISATGGGSDVTLVSTHTAVLRNGFQGRVTFKLYSNGVKSIELKDVYRSVASGETEVCSIPVDCRPIAPNFNIYITAINRNQQGGALTPARVNLYGGYVGMLNGATGLDGVSVYAAYV